MKKILLSFIFLISFLVASSTYVDQVKIVDRCTYLVEPLTMKSLGITPPTKHINYPAAA